MAKRLSDLRPVYVIGIGWHRYQSLSDKPYVELGLKAIRDALSDASIEWSEVESSYVATARLGMAVGRSMLRHLGAHGKPLIHIENASASGSAAFRQACIEVGAGISDVVLAVGVDKPAARTPRASTGVRGLADDAIVPFTSFALLTNEYARRNHIAPEDIALVAVKNHRNGATNPNAQRQQLRTLEEILSGRPVSGTLTALQCTPVGEGAAAVIVASEDAIKRLGVDPSRVVRVAASAAASERGGSARADKELTQEVVAAVLDEAGLLPTALDIIELHDAFTIEELHYAEATGVCPEGQFIPRLKEGEFDIGGRCAISTSGGLIAFGHPIGPTGIGQVGEVTLQLRGEAGVRQHKGARVGLAHMVGVGAVCYGHILVKP
jgi:acetyl-CoA acetyltransferase